jgi:hypothetical protein
MTDARFEYEEVAEFGGGFDSAKEPYPPYERVKGEGEVNVAGNSLKGRFNAPVCLAPLLIMIGAIVRGGFIWAAASWQAGLAVMIGSLGAYMLFAFFPLRK